jgi:hypothetical protein
MWYLKLCKKLGVNYIWGLFNFTFGVIAGTITAGITAGMIQ